MPAPEGAIHEVKLTLAGVRAELRTLGITITHNRDWQEYRVNYRGGSEATAYYASDLADALTTGRFMHDEAERQAAETSKRMGYQPMTLEQIEQAAAEDRELRRLP